MNQRRTVERATIAVTGARVAQVDGTWRVHHSFGRWLTMLADRVGAIHLHAPLIPQALYGECDFPLEHPRISVHPWDERIDTAHAMRQPIRLIRGYWRLAADGDALLLRGGGPLLWTCHLFAALRQRPVVHWFVSNPMAILAGPDRGYGFGWQRLGHFYAWLDYRLTRLGLAVSRARVLANGDEVKRLYPSSRTEVVVSTSIRAEDFLDRADTCTGPGIRLLYVGYIRPEKGVEFLLRALPHLRDRRPIRLAIVGSAEQFPAEHARLRRVIEELHLTDRVDWEGYAAFGPALFGQMDRSDVLVLPSLSEGTPRVLVEARARSLPIVSTTVGGIPSSVTHEADGLLVPPRDANALAIAIQRMIDDGELRRRLIRAGQARVREWTLERFVDRLVNVLADSAP